jgi:hypothetical protein
MSVSFFSSTSIFTYYEHSIMIMMVTARFNRSNSALFQFYVLNLTHYFYQIERSVYNAPVLLLQTTNYKVNDKNVSCYYSDCFAGKQQRERKNSTNKKPNYFLFV